MKLKIIAALMLLIVLISSGCSDTVQDEINQTNQSGSSTVVIPFEEPCKNLSINLTEAYKTDYSHNIKKEYYVAKGTYLKIFLEAENTGKKSIDLEPENIKLKYGDGCEYVLSRNESLMESELENAGGDFFGSINPKVVSKGVIVFDVPENFNGTVTLCVEGEGYNCSKNFTV
ncbi:MAG: DUF4352 domain-containing protein [Methanogenium sp.]|jgi:hypothetical protein